MRFNCGLTKETRDAQEMARLQKIVDRDLTWRPWFAWYPVKVADHDCRWLETMYARRLHARVFTNIWGEPRIQLGPWDDITKEQYARLPREDD